MFNDLKNLILKVGEFGKDQKSLIAVLFYLNFEIKNKPHLCIHIMDCVDHNFANLQHLSIGPFFANALSKQCHYKLIKDFFQDPELLQFHKFVIRLLVLHSLTKFLEQISLQFNF